MTAICDGFEYFRGMKGCIGAIDGTHIPIKAPHDCREKYMEIGKAFTQLRCNRLWTINLNSWIVILVGLVQSTMQEFLIIPIYCKIY